MGGLNLDNRFLYLQQPPRRLMSRDRTLTALFSISFRLCPYPVESVWRDRHLCLTLGGQTCFFVPQRLVPQWGQCPGLHKGIPTGRLESMAFSRVNIA